MVSSCIAEVSSDIEGVTGFEPATQEVEAPRSAIELHALLSPATNASRSVSCPLGPTVLLYGLSAFSGSKVRPCGAAVIGQDGNAPSANLLLEGIVVFAGHPVRLAGVHLFAGPRTRPSLPMCQDRSELISGD